MRTIRFKSMRAGILFLLLFLVLSSAAFAQVDNKKALDEDAVAALVEKLGGLLSYEIKDEDKISEITDKWAGREDLVGKTESAIMSLFWEDVKAVVTDQYIYNNVWLRWVLGPSWQKPEKLEDGPAMFKIEDDGYSGSKLAILYSDVERFNCRTLKCDINERCSSPTAELCDSRPAGIRHRQFNSNEGSWRFEPAGDGFYYIFLGLTQKAIVAGDSADNRIYLHEPNGRDNAKWKLVPLGNNKFHITDRKHNRSLVAGDNPDGTIYHQVTNGRRNAIWNIVLIYGKRNIPDELKSK